jgi:hypothetical protein
VHRTELAQIHLGAGGVRGIDEPEFTAVCLRVGEKPLGRRVVVRAAVRGSQMSVVALQRVLLERVPRCVELGIKLIDARGTAALDLLDDLLARGRVLPLKLGESKKASYVRLAGRKLVTVNQDLQ